MIASEAKWLMSATVVCFSYGFDRWPVFTYCTIKTNNYNNCLNKLLKSVEIFSHSSESCAYRRFVFLPSSFLRQPETT